MSDLDNMRPVCQVRCLRCAHADHSIPQTTNYPNPKGNLMNITIDGVDYAPVSASIPGSRAIVVLDRGWIFVGNLEHREDGTCRLTNAANVRKWQTGGYGGLTKDPVGAQVDMDPCADLEFATAAMLFCTPVSDDWGS